MFDVKVIADSGFNETRLTTLQLRYPRFIHAEFMTHRVFSRNASSSRAIPVSKMIEEVRTSPAVPIHWGKNQPGMQAKEELSLAERVEMDAQWRAAANQAADAAEKMANIGAHKQVVNRILEPFLHISVVVTATEWNNFFALRCHKDAQPEIRHLALMMSGAMRVSEPVMRNPGEWHLPYVEERLDDRGKQGFVHDGRWLELDTALKCSVARCARVSYNNHDGTTTTVEKDLELYDRLVGSTPRHASPAEHQATPSSPAYVKQYGYLSGNFDPSWIQYRQLLDKLDPAAASLLLA